MNKVDGARVALDQKLDQMGRAGQIDPMTENVLRMRGGVGASLDRKLGSKLDGVDDRLSLRAAVGVLDIEQRAVAHTRSVVPAVETIAAMQYGKGARPDDMVTALIVETHAGVPGQAIVSGRSRKR